VTLTGILEPDRFYSFADGDRPARRRLPIEPTWENDPGRAEFIDGLVSALGMLATGEKEEDGAEHRDLHSSIQQEP
jgi:hypothetical protein